MLLVFLVYAVQAFQETSIPEFSTPPERRWRSCAVYDEAKNRIITFGGQVKQQDAYSSDLNSYKIGNNIWEEITPQSYFVPPGMVFSELYLRSDRVLLVFYGSTFEDLSSDVYSCDLSTNVWTTVTLYGDYIPSRTLFAHTNFNYSNNEYIAIFGGITKNGVSNELFL